ncbi:MAG: hypothetical protein D6731_00820 [Planctomycetota bacterium]|nr:MAG: hypothetical protein D6731_00820 [Planctomycetota bacterium]
MASAKVWIQEAEAPAEGFAVEFAGCERIPRKRRDLERSFGAVRLRERRLQRTAADEGGFLASLLCREGQFGIRAEGDRLELIARARTPKDAPLLVRATEALGLEVLPARVRLRGSIAPQGEESWWDYPPEGALFLRAIEARRSEHQTIEVCEHPVYGRLLLLNGETQISSSDEPLYSRSLVEPAVKKRTRRVCILGGGDCGVLREVLSHPQVEEAVMVDLDPEVVATARRHFPEVVAGATEDPRARIIYGDAFAFLRERRGWDLVIHDISDTPLGVGSPQEILGVLRAALAPRGRLAMQCGSAHWRYAEGLQETLRALRAHFRRVKVRERVIPSFLEQPWVFAFCRP